MRNDSTASKKPAPFTYDDYMRSLGDKEALIDIADVTLKERFARVIDVVERTFKGHFFKLKDLLTGYRAKYDVKMPKPVVHAYRKVGKKGSIALGSTASLIVLVLLGQFIFGNDSPNVKGINTTNGQPAKPTFEPVVTETIREDQGLVFDPEKGIATFKDVISGYNVTVSQQPWNEEQAKDPEKSLSEVSVALLAAGSFETKKGRAYFTKPGPEEDPSQTVMFTTKGLLIFVRTPGVTISNEAWTEYINNIK
jgi:hypothetical protein